MRRTRSANARERANPYEPIAHCSKDPNPPPPPLPPPEKLPKKRGRPPKTKSSVSETLVSKSSGRCSSRISTLKFSLDKSQNANEKSTTEQTPSVLKSDVSNELQISVENNSPDVDPFDKLIENDHDLMSPTGNFIKSKNVRTYSNKHRRDEDIEILEFHDCQNRDMIVKWLNDNQDNFDRITQSQDENLFSQGIADFIPLTFDMNSVSQIASRSPRKRKKLKVTINRNNAKRIMRTKSLDETRTTQKTTLTRLKSYSVAGDDLNAENYNIEDSSSDIAVNEEDLVLMNLMEDHCLSEIEREIAMKQKDSSKDEKGWKRVKEMDKIIKKMNKTPKKLDVVIQVTPKSNSPVKDANLESNVAKNRTKRVLVMPEMESPIKITKSIMPDSEVGHHVYNLDNFEMFAQQNHVLLETSSGNISEKIEETPDIVTLGKNFVEGVKKITNLDVLTALNPFLVELTSIFHKFGFINNNENPNKIETKNVEIQTLSDVYFIETGTMTDVPLSEETGVQTESAILPPTPTKSSIIIQASPNKPVMADSLDYVCFDTQNLIEESLKSKQHPDENDVVPPNKKDVEPVEKESNESNNEMTQDKVASSRKRTSKSVKRSLNESSQLRYSLRSRSNSKSSESLIDLPRKKRKSQKSEGGKRTYEDFEPFLTPAGNLKGFYSLRSKSPVKASQLNNSISVSLPRRSPRISNKENESQLICTPRSSAPKSPKKSQVLVESVENDGGRPCQKFINEDLSVCFESNSQNYESQLPQHEVIKDVHLSVKENDKPEVVQSLEKNTKIDTQDMIAHCDDIIHNAMKPAAKISSQDPFSDEIFQSHSMFLDEDNLKKIENDISKFVAKDGTLNASSDIIPETEAFQEMKISRKRLFCEVIPDSESYFDKAEVIENEENSNKRRKSQNSHIVIIQDLKIKEAIQSDEEVEVLSESSDEIFNSQSDCDMIETTPQKPCTSFRVNVSKAEETSLSSLEVTLPPPAEFRDITTVETIESNDVTLISNSVSPLEVQLQLGHHSTPQSKKPESQSCHLSPITHGSDNRTPGPYDWAQKSDRHPFTIKSTSSSQKSSEKSMSLTTPSATKQNSIMRYVRHFMSGFSPSPHSQPEYKPCVSCSRLPKEDVMLISNLAVKKLIIYCPNFGANVTHMVVKVDEKNRVQDHTIKYILAIASGLWIVSIQWVLDSLEANRIMPEEAYEVADLSGVEGPKESRLNRRSNPLLKGYKIHVSPPFVTTTRKDIENVVRLLGGVVAAEPEDLLDKNGFVCVIVQEAMALVNFEMCDTWLEVFKVVTVDVEWLSRSVSQYKLLSFRNYALCSDDSISELGYPPDLLAKVPYTCSTSISTVSN